MYTCMCNWAECSNWTKVLASSLEHQHLGSIARLRYGTLQINIDRAATATDTKAKQKYQEKIRILTEYRIVVLKHLGVGQLSIFSGGRDIYIARHHFPHTYLRTNPNCSYYAPIPEDVAQTLGIGILPRDKVNVANYDKREYFLVPNVKKGDVKSMVDMLMHGKGLDRKSRANNRTCFQTPPAKTILSAVYPKAVRVTVKVSGGAIHKVAGAALREESDITMREITPLASNSFHLQQNTDANVTATNLHLEDDNELPEETCNLNSYTLPVTDLV